MTGMPYREQLLHPNWQRKRLEILAAADFKCRDCGSGENTLHVHHLRYRRGAMAWEYENSDLVALCEECHAERHFHADGIKDAVAQLGMQDLSRLRRIAWALCGPERERASGKLRALLLDLFPSDL